MRAAGCRRSSSRVPTSYRSTQNQTVTSCRERERFLVTERFHIPQCSGAEDLTFRLDFRSAPPPNSAQRSENSLVPELMENVARKLGGDVAASDVMWR